MKTTFISIAVILCCISMSGCKSRPNIQVIETDTQESECRQEGLFGAFSDMSFIWEGWFYSTNKVETIK